MFRGNSWDIQTWYSCHGGSLVLFLKSITAMMDLGCKTSAVIFQCKTLARKER